MAQSRAGAPGGNRVALYSVESPRRSLAPDPEPAGRERPPRILKHAHVCVHACVRACVFFALSEPQDAHPPISRDRAEHEMLGERSDPAASVAGLCRISEGGGEVLC